MNYQNLLYSVDDRVATVTLNRPERHNALSTALVDEIMAAMTQADRDPEVRIVILAGAGGKAFSSGYDIKNRLRSPSARSRTGGCACRRTSSSPIRSGTARSPSSP